MLLCCLRRNIEAACHTFRRRLPSKTNSVAHQRLVSSTRWSVTAKCIALRAHSTLWSQASGQNRDFCLPHLYSTPPLRGFPSEYCYAVWQGKTRMMWLPDGENILMLCLFVLTQFTNVTDTHTPHDGIGRAYASRGKN